MTARTMEAQKDLVTAEDPAVSLCTLGGVVEHDYRLYVRSTSYPRGGSQTHLRCVWCHAVACGDPDQDDPCLEVYHHQGYHRTRAGVRWQIGSMRP